MFLSLVFHPLPPPPIRVYLEPRATLSVCLSSTSTHSYKLYPKLGLRHVVDIRSCAVCAQRRVDGLLLAGRSDILCGTWIIAAEWQTIERIYTLFGVYIRINIKFEYCFAFSVHVARLQSTHKVPSTIAFNFQRYANNSSTANHNNSVPTHTKKM